MIDDDATGDIETSGTFDPATDGIDFYESLEGMLLQVNDAIAVGPRSAFGEIPIVVDDGVGAGIRTNRGGVVIRSNDFNPERIHLDDTLLATPVVNVGDGFTTPARGVLDYSFGNFKLNVTSALTRVDRGLVREATAIQSDHQIAVATYNVENLDPSDGSAFARHADLIVDHLRSPDLIAIEEIQDNDGATNTSVTDASTTWNMLIGAISAAGGPAYQFRQIDPVDDQDGGEPGGNIRVGFLFRTDRGLEFIDRPGGGPDDSDSGDRTPVRPAALLQPGPSAAAESRVHHLAQAARGRVPHARQEGVRGGQPLRIQGRRPPALRPLPAAAALERGSAARASTGRERVRRFDPHARHEGQRDRAR